MIMVSPFDAVGFTAGGFIHHLVNRGIFTSRNGFEKLQQAQHTLPACEVGLGLGGRIGGIRTKDVIGVTTPARRSPA